MTEIEREDDLDDASYQIRETFAQYSVAMYSVQVLEQGLVNALTVAQTSSDPKSTQSRFDLNFDTNLSVTMGRLLHRLRPFVNDDPDLITALEGALVLRNHFAHDFWVDHDTDFMTFSGREAMIAESLAAVETFRQVDARLEPVLHRYFASIGVSASELAALVKAEIDRRRQESIVSDEGAANINGG